MTRVLALDVGKTRCRAVLFTDGARTAAAEQSGCSGLAEPTGVADALVAIGAATAGWPRPDAVVAGLAGFASARGRAPALGAGLQARFGACEVLLASDMTASHAGALAGAPGVVLAAGTGSVALAVAADGRSHAVDGWGYLLGDAGSGYAIGRAGLADALAAHDGRGGSAALLARARDRFGALHTLPAQVHGSANPPRTVAAFARDVAAAAREGDPTARGILATAARALAATAAAAARGVAPLPARLACCGGLLDTGDLLTGPLDTALAELVPDLARVPAAGDALDGAALLAARPELPHHALTVRFAPVAPLRTARESALGTRLARLDTERPRPDLADLDTRPARAVVDLIAREDADVVQVVHGASAALAVVVEVAVERLRRGGRLVYVGAGTAGRLAVLDAAELAPTYGAGPETVRALLAGAPAAMVAAVEGAEDDTAAARRDLAGLDPRPEDVVVGISASGRTPYVLAALAAAREAGAVTVGIANNPGSELAADADLVVELPTGPEIVAGSTRMKAGTSQKLVLTTLSTAVMVGLGKVHGNLMVDLRATNEKLRVRAARIVADATEAAPAQVAAALDAAGGHARTAIVMLLAGVDADGATARLDRAGGRVREAVR